MDDEKRFFIPPVFIDANQWFPATEDLPAGAWHVTAAMKELHARGITGKGIKVGINDTAGRTDHPFLPKELAGRDFTNSRYGTIDKNGHATHCAGIVISIAPGASLIMSKVLGDDGTGSTIGINAGRVWLAEQGAQIISESLGDNGGLPIQADLIAYDKAYSLGTRICVAALGNAGYNGRDSVGRPGSYTTKNHGIAAIQSDWKTIASFSSGGPAARFANSGVGIISCKPGGGWVSMSGTSMATPAQAALYALVMDSRRSLGLRDLIGAKEWSDWFVDNKITIDLGQPGWDPRFGNGLVSVSAVIEFLLKVTPTNV